MKINPKVKSVFARYPGPVREKMLSLRKLIIETAKETEQVSRLLETFRLVFGSKFQYEGKRAIIFRMNQKIPVEELKACIRAALTYHKVKNLQTLGI